MGTTAQRFYPHITNWDGTDPAGGDVVRCDTSLPAFNEQSICNFGSSGAKQITVDPSTSTAGTGVNSALGWAINIAGADGMDGTTTAKRIITNSLGGWVFQGGLKAAPVASLAACTVGIYVYRVAASPSTTRTLLFSTSVSAGLVATAGTNWTVSPGGLNPADIILEAGETIQITYTLTCTGQVGGLTIAFLLGNGTITNDVYFDLPTPGLRTYYPRDVADSGPAITDDLTRIVDFPRALADSGPAPTDDLSRLYIGARDLADAGPAPTDTLTRIADFPRAIADAGPAPTDDLQRLFTGARSLADSGPAPVDDLQRSFVGARSLDDSGPSPADDLQRLFTGARSMADAGPNPTDDLLRLVTFNRSLDDAGPIPVDDMTRIVDFPRALSDAGPVPTDDLQRIATFPRSMSDAGPNPTDDLLRLATFNRSLADPGPVPSDDLQRVFVGARDLADAGPAPVDSMARQVTYARTLEDDLTTPGGTTTIIKKTIFGLFD